VFLMLLENNFQLAALSSSSEHGEDAHSETCHGASAYSGPPLTFPNRISPSIAPQDEATWNPSRPHL
jgi:hypothetical protein